MPLTSFTVLIIVLWCLAGLVLVLHRLSVTSGMGPLLIFLGGLVFLIQRPGHLNLLFDLEWFTFHLPSHAIFPAILLGILMIYVVNGSSQARFAVESILLVIFLSALLEFLYPFLVKLPGSLLPEVSSSSYTLRGFVASAASFTADLLAMIVVYQSICNRLGRFPSRLAAVSALIAALWTDALLYTAIGHFGEVRWLALAANDMIGKTIPVLVLWPLLHIYLTRIAPRLPNTAATTPRPALDLFTTRLQLEARARHHYSLLRTMSAINQLILRTNTPEELLETACKLLVTSRDYPLVWVGLVMNNSEDVYQSAVAGRARETMKSVHIQLNGGPYQNGPAATAIKTGERVLLNDIGNRHPRQPWQEGVLSAGLLATAAFPLKHRGETFGVLCVFGEQANPFESEELLFLEEIADDLAYALINLDARQQQQLLQTAAETMRDGLLIMDLKGRVVYANPILIKSLGVHPGTVENKMISEILPSHHAARFTNEYLPGILREGRFTLDFEYETPAGKPLFASLHSALSHNHLTGEDFIVINVRDVTFRKRFEHQLLTLSHLTTDLVQIHEPRALLQAILQSGEELLQADASMIYMISENDFQSGEIVSHHIIENKSAQVQQLFHHVIQNAESLPRQPVCSPHLIGHGKDSNLFFLLQSCGYESLVLLPVHYHQKPLGFLGLFYKEQKEYHEEECQLGKTVAQTLAIVLKNAQLYQDLQKQNMELEEHVQERTVELRTAKDRIEAILVSVPDAVFVLDETGCLVEENPAGKSLREAAGKVNINLFSPHFLLSLTCESNPTERTILDVQGRAYQALASSLSSSAGQRPWKVIVFRDVTHFRELDKMKSQFVSDVSHELRTPLTNLTLYLDLLTEHMNTERRSSYLATLHRETKRLTYLIEDLLMISRLEAGREPINIEAVNVNSLVKDLVVDRSPMAAKKDVALSYTTAPDLPAGIADQRLLTQILSNLLTNALNYTPGPGKVSVRTEYVQENGNRWVKIAVTDSGVGIPEQEMQHIFERFYRGDASRKTGAAGTGLGLAISQEIIARMEGKITVHSLPGAGSTFSIWIPAKKG